MVKNNCLRGNTRHCTIMLMSSRIKLWYLSEFKWLSIFFKIPTPYLKNVAPFCEPCWTVLFVQIELKRSWSNLLMVPLSQWLSVRNMHSSLKTTWYQCSLDQSFLVLAQPILRFRCLSVKKTYLQFYDRVICTSAISCSRYFLTFDLLTSYCTILQYLLKTNTCFLDKFCKKLIYLNNTK